MNKNHICLFNKAIAMLHVNMLESVYLIKDTSDRRVKRNMYTLSFGEIEIKLFN